MKKIDKRISVFDAEIEHEIPEEPKEFMEYFEKKIGLIPEEYKDTTRILLEPNMNYDSPVLNLDISYERIETDEEFEKRKAMIKQREEFRENQELCELERLKKKFNV